MNEDDTFSLRIFVNCMYYVISMLFPGLLMSCCGIPGFCHFYACLSQLLAFDLKRWRHYLNIFLT